jgi:hypothetical protein
MHAGNAYFFKGTLKMCAMSQTPDSQPSIATSRTDAFGYDAGRRTEACGIVAENEQPRRRKRPENAIASSRIHLCPPPAAEGCGPEKKKA